MTFCSNCGRELPEGALFCPDCGTSAVDFSVAQSDVSPSHFNSGMTATSPPQTTAQPEESGFALPPSPSPQERRRSSFAGRRGLMLAIIAILAVLLVGATFETGMLGSGVGSDPAVNSASTPLTGGQLYTAYAANESQAAASYTNKTVYIQDSLDFGVGRDYRTGQYYSSVDSGTVILFWSNPSQVAQLSAGATVLAKCSVEGVQFSPRAGYLLYLQGCDLVSVQSQATTTTTTAISYPAANIRLGMTPGAAATAASRRSCSRTWLTGLSCCTARAELRGAALGRHRGRSSCGAWRAARPLDRGLVGYREERDRLQDLGDEEQDEPDEHNRQSRADKVERGRRTESPNSQPLSHRAICSSEEHGRDHQEYPHYEEPRYDSEDP